LAPFIIKIFSNIFVVARFIGRLFNPEPVTGFKKKSKGDFQSGNSPSFLGNRRLFD